MWVCQSTSQSTKQIMTKKIGHRTQVRTTPHTCVCTYTWRDRNTHVHTHKIMTKFDIRTHRLTAQVHPHTHAHTNKYTHTQSHSLATSGALGLSWLQERLVACIGRLMLIKTRSIRAGRTRRRRSTVRTCHAAESGTDLSCRSWYSGWSTVWTGKGRLWTKWTADGGGRITGRVHSTVHRIDHWLKEEQEEDDIWWFEDTMIGQSQEKKCVSIGGREKNGKRTDVKHEKSDIWFHI